MKDNKLFELAQKHAEVHQKIKKLNDLKGDLNRKITEELEERGVEKIVGDGLQVTYVQQWLTDYDVKKARKVLGPTLYKKVIVEKIDTNALEYQIQQGKVEVDDIEKFSSLRPKKPYTLITPYDDDEEEEAVS